MTFTIVLLSLLTTGLLITSIISSVFMLRLARVVMRMEDVIDKSLRGIDSSYATMSKIMEMPIASNDPQVERFLLEMRRVKDSILTIAGELTRDFKGKDE
jgi:hypothetical protein